MSLTEEKYISLRTYRKTGVGVDTPVWFASQDALTHYVFSAASAGKVKRLRISPKAQIATCDFRGGSIGTWLDCHAQLVYDLDEIALARKQLIGKYGWIMRFTDFLSWFSGRLSKRVYIRIELQHQHFRG